MVGAGGETFHSLEKALNEITTLAEALPAPFDTSTAALVLDEGNMNRLFALAEMMSSGRATLPKHLQGNKGDCLAVAMQATQWRMNPFAVAQKTHLVNGTLGYEAQLVIAVINNSGAITDRLNWEWFGPWEKIVGKFKQVESRTKKDDDGHAKKYIVPAWEPKDEEGLGVFVRATVKGEAHPRELVLLMTQARTRNSTLWTEDPKQQLAYLAAKRWGRLHTPDVMLGVYTPDELEPRAPRDMGPVEVVEHRAAELPGSVLDAWRAAADKGNDSARKFWAAMPPEQRKLATEDQKREVKAAADAADKRRTVDAAGQAPEKPATVAQAADPATGEVDDEFVRSMNAAEQGAAA